MDWAAFWRGFWYPIPHKVDGIWLWLDWQCIFHDRGILIARNWHVRGEWHYARRR